MAELEVAKDKLRRKVASNEKESEKEFPKSSEVTVHRFYPWILSSQGARGSPEKAPRELLRSFLGAKMELGEAQKSSPQAPEDLENDLKIKNLDFHETQ